MLRSSRTDQQPQTGVALLSVMFILTLLAVIAVYMVEADHLQLRRAGNQRIIEQGVQLVFGSEQWAARVLQRDLKNSKVDHPGEDWNSLGTPVTVDDGTLRTAISDMQSRFNINNLTTRDKIWYPAFKRLLRLLEIDEGLAEALVDWIDADQQRSHADGAEDLEYMLFDPPYRAANQIMADLGELVYVKGTTNDILDRLMPYVTVIPDKRATRININTCPPLLLQILGKGITAADAESLADGRGETGYESKEVFLQRPELAGEANITAEPMIALGSDYFLIKNQVVLGNLSLSMNSVIKRNAQVESVQVIQRERGYL